MYRFALAVLLAGIFILPVACLQGDEVSIGITWTAPGDDGNVGIANIYSIRYAPDSLTLINDWDNCPGCIIVSDPPVPDTAGTCQELTITNLQPNEQIYIAIKTADEIGNWSEISNILSVLTPAGQAPAKITDLNLGVCP